MPLSDAPIEIDPLRPVEFTEAVEWFAEQAPWVSGSSWAYMEDLALQKGWDIADNAALAMIEDVWGELDQAVSEGLPYSDFIRNLAKSVNTKWWKIDSSRMDLIFRNNVGSALMAGRFKQMEDPSVLADRPFWVFDGIADFRQSDICNERDGICLPAADPWWQTNRPLLHHNCRSSVIAVTEEEAAELGVTPRADLRGLPDAQEGWGAPAEWLGYEPPWDAYKPALKAEYEAWKNGQPYAQSKAQWTAAWKALMADALPPKARRRGAPVSAFEDAGPLADLTETLTWETDPTHKGLSLHGVPFKKAAEMKWDAIPNQPINEPPLPKGLGSVSTGVVVVEPDGRIWILEPKSHYGGYQRTFPKGKLEPDLTGQQNALKELWEETGLTAEITSYLGDFKGTTGVSRYYIAKRTGGAPWASGPESQSVSLLTMDNAAQLLNMPRDKDILATVRARLAGEPVPAGLQTYVEPPDAVAAMKAEIEALKAKIAKMKADQRAAEAAAAALAGDPEPDMKAIPLDWAQALDPSKYVVASSKTGGSTPGVIVEHPDAPGVRFLVKQNMDRIKADAEISGSELYSLFSDTASPAFQLTGDRLPADVKGRGRYFTIQMMEPDVTALTSVVGAKGWPDFSKLTPDQQAQLLAHGMAAWATGEHDGHADQYLIKQDGTLHRIDFGQALKYTLTTGDKLALDYHPNQMYAEAQPAHLILLQQIQSGKVDKSVLYHPAVKEAAAKISAVTMKDIGEAVALYSRNNPGGKTQAQIKKLLYDRAKATRQDWAQLFEQVTGEPYSWKAKKAQKRKAAPPPPSQVARPTRERELQRGLEMKEIAPTLSKVGGVTILADGDKLRSQAWRVQQQKVGAEDQYVFFGELDQSIWGKVTRSVRASGGQAKPWSTYRVTSGVGVLKQDPSTSSVLLGNGLVVKKGGKERYEVTWGDPSVAHTVQHGQLRIRVYEKDPAQAQKIFAQALEDLGLRDEQLTKPPTPEQERLALYNRALWNIEGGKFRPRRDQYEAASALIAAGVDPLNLKVRQNQNGYTEPVIDGRHERYRSRGLRMLYHQFTEDDAVIQSITGADGGAGGLLSTVARTEHGIFRKGMSSGDDVLSGGASSTFARIVGDPNAMAGKEWYYTSTKFTAILTPKILDRVDWYAFDGDNFGDVTSTSWRPFKFSERRGADEAAAMASARGRRDNEVMFRNAIEREAILFYAVATDKARKQALEALKKAGVKTIRGQPLEEMVVVMTTPSDYSNLKASNPVHAYLMGKADDYPAWDEVYGGKP